MSREVVRGTITLAEAEDEKTIAAPSVVDEGICQLSMEILSPADAVVSAEGAIGGQFTIRRKSHHGQRIEIAYTIRYGLSGRIRAEA